MKLKAIAIATLTCVTLAAYTSSAAAGGPLLNDNQKEVDLRALSLRHEPAVVAARDALEKHWKTFSPYTLKEGKATLSTAVDDVVFLALRSAASDPAKPQVVWTVTPSFTIGGHRIPSSRNGDNPDRIYRFAAVDAKYKYVVHGKRNATPSLPQFSFEAQKGGIWTTAVLSSENIDLAPDGSFTVTADSEKAEGKRNHLYLPPETSNLLIRDTLADWSSQLPNDLQIERIDDTPSTPRDRAEIVKQATKFIAKLDEAYVQFLELPWKLPVNQLKPALRPLAYGLPGSGAAIGRFSIKSNEALVVTLDTVGAKYLGFVLGDPWQRSLNYWDHFASLNNFQAKANDDGTITYVISIKDPGVNNWLDTEGLHNGIITLRWEGFPPGADISKGFRGAQVVKLSDLASVLPAGTVTVTPAERAQQLADRKAGFALRVAE